MLSTVFKYFFITLCSTFIYFKINNIDLNKKYITINLLFVTLCTPLVCLTRKIYISFTLIALILLFVFYIHLSLKKAINETIPFVLISVGISYITYTFSSLIIGPICYIIFNHLNENILNTISLFNIGVFQIALSCLLFKIKRFKKGLSYYETKLTSDLGVFISIAILLIASLFSDQENKDLIGTLLIFCVLLVGLLMLFWWRKHIANIYLERIHKRNIEILENSLSEQKEIAENLKKHNEELSKIIHKDNKIIPAMLLAVEEMLKCDSVDEQKEKSKSLLSQLKTMSAERAGIITEYEDSNKKFPETGIASVNASIKYLFCKAKERDISFDLLVVTDIKNITNDIVSEDDFNTLVLDLGENAIIAVSNADFRNVLIVIGFEAQNLTLSVYDSGNYFDRNVIDNLGIKRVTTHKKTGGTGIGLMTTFEILKKYNASFILDEKIDNNKYSKKVSVCFDGCNQNRIQTHNDYAVNSTL